MSSNNRQVIVFDVSSSFGFFRKNFTTTNALTFSVIPRSAVEGLIGSIVGIDRESFPGLLESSKVAVQLMSPVKKINIKYMHINRFWWEESLSRYLNGKQFVLYETRKQIAVPASVEFLVNPKYRIYVDTNKEEINSNLITHLRDKKSFYTPYLGGSSMIASIKYVGEFGYESVNNKGGYLPVSSLIPFFDKIPSIKFESGLTVATEEDISFHITNERKSLGTYSVIYNNSGDDGGKIQVNDKGIIKVNDIDRHIKFLPTQRNTPERI